MRRRVSWKKEIFLRIHTLLVVAKVPTPRDVMTNLDVSLAPRGIDMILCSANTKQ